MVLPAARYLRDGDATQLLVAESADRLCFLLPLSGGRGIRGLPLPKLRSWTHDYCFLGTPLLSGHDDPDQVWRAIRGQLRHGWPAPLLVMPLHASDGPVATALRRTDPHAGLGVRQSPDRFRGFVHRRPDPTYAAEWIASRHRANLAGADGTLPAAGLGGRDGRPGRRRPGQGDRGVPGSGGARLERPSRNRTAVPSRA
jgi:hypothetical protein